MLFQHTVVFGVILHQCTEVTLTGPRMICWGFLVLVCLIDNLAYLNIYVRSIGTDFLLNMWAPYWYSRYVWSKVYSWTNYFSSTRLHSYHTKSSELVLDHLSMTQDMMRMIHSWKTNHRITIAHGHFICMGWSG